ncbi:hypothetical protein T484DRAFT_3388544 [Baffinella frigidus]|nr:hypothetical protein T484DRAFT_3388544 [Cryptophyta sp. CCMP2293]
MNRYDGRLKRALASGVCAEQPRPKIRRPDPAPPQTGSSARVQKAGGAAAPAPSHQGGTSSLVQRPSPPDPALPRFVAADLQEVQRAFKGASSAAPAPVQQARLVSNEERLLLLQVDVQEQIEGYLRQEIVDLKSSANSSLASDNAGLLVEATAARQREGVLQAPRYMRMQRIHR